MARIVPDVWDVPEEIRERLGARGGRQRLVAQDGHAVLALHQVPKDATRDRELAIFWRDPEGTWRCAPGRDGIATLRAHVEAYAEYLDLLDDQLEAATRASDYFDVVTSARPVQRAARNMQAVLQQLRDALPDADELIGLRERAYEVERLSDFVVDDAHNGMQLMVAQRAEEQARVSAQIARQSHRLNMLAAIFLPVTGLGAILGMNLQNGLEGLPEPLAFWAIVAGAIVVGLVIRARLQREGD